MAGVRDVKLAVDVRGAARADAEIAADVSDRLRDDARTDGTDIKVVVNGRAVVLSGVVGSLAQRDAIVDDAEVESVANVDAQAVRVDWREYDRARSAASHAPSTDDQIKAAVNRAMTGEVRVGRPPPSIEVDHGVVVLSGNVIDFRAAHAADRLANGVRGVRSVDDRMTVLPSSTQSDVVIQREVERALYNGLGDDARTVKISTKNGKVTVQGEVASQEERMMIADEVESIPGVVALEDETRVVGYGHETHGVALASIERRATENMFWDPMLTSGKPMVTFAPSGDATLTGTVLSWPDAQAAVDDCVRAGAAHVTNLLRVAGVR